MSSWQWLGFEMFALSVLCENVSSVPFCSSECTLECKLDVLGGKGTDRKQSNLSACFQSVFKHYLKQQFVTKTFSLESLLIYVDGITLLTGIH